MRPGHAQVSLLLPGACAQPPSGPQLQASPQAQVSPQLHPPPVESWPLQRHEGLAHGRQAQD
ncbi:MAG: hypothetical protein U1A78_17810 [Polyangia bacterium]